MSTSTRKVRWSLASQRPRHVGFSVYVSRILEPSTSLPQIRKVGSSVMQKVNQEPDITFGDLNRWIQQVVRILTNVLSGNRVDSSNSGNAARQELSST